MRKLIAAFLAATALFAPCRLYAWSADAHHIVGHIAEKHLTPEAQYMCQKYLRYSLTYYAVWMDHVANCKGYDHTRVWHGVRFNSKNKVLHLDGNNAVYQSQRLWNEMRNGGYKELTDSAVIDNLRFLIHMVGDMHCPSHNYYPEEPDFQPYSIRRNGKKVYFHKFWDRSAGFFNKGWYCDDFEQIDTYSEKEIKRICKGDVYRWAQINGKDMREVHSLLIKHTELRDMPKENHERMREIVNFQLLRGAYRLAHILNDIFKDVKISDYEK